MGFGVYGALTLPAEIVGEVRELLEAWVQSCDEEGAWRPDVAHLDGDVLRVDLDGRGPVGEIFAFEERVLQRVAELLAGTDQDGQCVVEDDRDREVREVMLVAGGLIRPLAEAPLRLLLAPVLRDGVEGVRVSAQLRVRHGGEGIAVEGGLLVLAAGGRRVTLTTPPRPAPHARRVPVRVRASGDAEDAKLPREAPARKVAGAGTSAGEPEEPAVRAASVRGT